MGLAPNPRFPERTPTFYEGKTAPSPSYNQGPRRFEEHLVSDQDIPANFVTGLTAGADENITHRKNPDETLRERAHAGSASWILAPTFLGEFAEGAGELPQTYPQLDRGEGRKQRVNPVSIEG